MGTASAIEARELERVFGPFVAVDDVSFSVPRGQVVALLGPNGAGKSTLMRMLMGYLPPTRGQISINGFRLEHDRLQAAETVGYLPENGPLYPDMSPRESLRFLSRARGIDGSFAERLEAVTDVCSLEALLDRPIGTLSKGQRQRVGLAQALLHDPSLLILDEPTAGLDPLQIKQFRTGIRALAPRTTVLLSTHILQEVEAMADRILVMTRGRIVHDGPGSIPTADLEALFDSVTAPSPAGGAR